jgi:hypothetical protein
MIWPHRSNKLAADYVILPVDANLSIGGSGGGEVDEEREFTLPQGSKVDSKSVLFFNGVIGTYQNQALDFSININTKKVFSYNPPPPPNVRQSYHIIIQENVLKKPDKENIIEYEVIGNGYATISEVVLLVQKE